MTVYSGDRNHHNHIGKAAKNRNHPVSPQPSAIMVCMRRNTNLRRQAFLSFAGKHDKIRKTQGTEKGRHSAAEGRLTGSGGQYGKNNGR